MTTKSIQGYYLEDLTVGMSHEKTMIVNEEKINAFAELSGDFNPVHTDAEYAASKSKYV